jgi:hypothetical protein
MIAGNRHPKSHRSVIAQETNKRSKRPTGEGTKSDREGKSTEGETASTDQSKIVTRVIVRPRVLRL